MVSFLFLFAFHACIHLQNNPDAKRDHILKMKEVYRNSPDTPYPNENFIFLYRTVFDKTTQKEEILSSASGISFKRKNDTVYGLTAAHWCKIDPEYESDRFARMFGYETYENLSKSINLKVDFYGKSHNMEIVDMDIKNDVCLIKFKSEYSNKIKNIKIANKYPKLGDNIYTISSPHGVNGKGIRLHFDGKFSGCNDEKSSRECWYTIPGIFGSSGSGILNKNGELVGILTFALVRFHNVTGGVKIEDIKAIIEKNL